MTAGTDGSAATAVGEQVLARATGVELLGETPGSGYRNPPALVRRGDGQVITLTPLLQQVMHAVDGHRTVAEVAEEVSASSGRLVRADDVAQLVDTSLRPLGLLLRADGTEPELRRSDPLLALRFRRVVTDPAVTRRLTAPFAVLFSPFVVVPVVLAFGLITGWVLFSQGLAAATAQAFGNPALFLAVVVLTVLSAGFHEFGHAAGARYGGSTPGAMGFGFYLFWPAFYTDVTDSYRLGRAGRVRTDLGGLYFNALVVLGVFAVWWLTGWHAVLLIVATQILQMTRQLLPLLRFDGYHVLADLTGVPDLYQRIGPVMSGLLPGRWHQPEATALKPWARAVVVALDPARRPADGRLAAVDGAGAPAGPGDGVGRRAAAGRAGRCGVRRRRRPRRAGPRTGGRRPGAAGPRPGIRARPAGAQRGHRRVAAHRGPARPPGRRAPARRGPRRRARLGVVARRGPLPTRAGLGGWHRPRRRSRREQRPARRRVAGERPHDLARGRRAAAHR